MGFYERLNPSLYRNILDYFWFYDNFMSLTISKIIPILPQNFEHTFG